MLTYYRDKVVLITGGASGIGRSLGEALVREGAKVILSDYDALRVATASEGIGCESAPLDVRDREEFEALVGRIVKTHGHLDILINNAGVAVTGETHRFDYEDWKRVVDINLYGVINGVHAAYPSMVERQSGHIINIASIAGLFPSAGQVSYVASKHAVVGLSHALRSEAADHGVRVTVVCPGIIATPMRDSISVKGQGNEKLLQALPEGMPVERCARIILRRSARNAHTIVVTPLANLLAGVMRLSPGLGLWMNRLIFRHMRRKILE